MMPTHSGTPFTIDIPRDVLDDLRARLTRTRFAERTGDQSWAAGADPDFLRGLIAYWADEFDWRARERELNSVPHFRTEIDGQLVHYVYVPGVRAPGLPAPIPLVLTHGWPSAFVEMLPLVPLLTDPASHGGDPADAFDVVIPSLPGSVFSDLPVSGPWTNSAVADLWVRLMCDVLGYPRFGAYGGDIGATVTNFLGARHPGRLVGIHLLHPALPAFFAPDWPLSPAERAYVDRRKTENEDDGGYSAIQSTRPDTIAAALIDSPAGLAAWFVDKFRAWGDTHGDIASRFDRDLLLTIITLYWATGTIGSSFRPYYDDAQNPPLPRIAVPAGVTLGIEDFDYPRELADRTYDDIRHWREATVGGHFLPLEEPALLAAELRAFFRPLRPTATSPP